MSAVKPGTPQTLMDAMFGPHLYTLTEEGEPVGTFDVRAWARWIDSSDNTGRWINHTLPDGVRVSTCFTGVDQAFGNAGNFLNRPLLWHTMIIGGQYDKRDSFASNLYDARRNHSDALDLVSGNHNPRKG